MLRIVALTIVAFNLNASTALAENTYPSPYSDATLEQLSQQIVGFFKQQKLVGAGFGLATAAGPFFLQGYGLADREKNIPVDPNSTLFRWASVAKTLTAVLAVMLSEKEAIDLDRPIERYLKDYSTPKQILFNGCKRPSCVEPIKKSKKITLRMLLAHVAGIQHYRNGLSSPKPPLKAINNPSINTGIEWALPFFASKPLVSLPGYSYNYSTVGYNLAGVVMEHATGKSFAQLLKENVTEPNNLPTLQADYGWVDIPHRAAGYWQGDKQKIMRRLHNDISWKLPGGGALSSLFDLTNYCSALLDGSRLLKNKVMRKQLWRRHYPKISGYGLGFRVGKWNNRQLIVHDGAQEKSRSLLVLYPEDNLCFTFVTNSEFLNRTAMQQFFYPRIDTLLSYRKNDH
jgi:CubicO group peptidase (beta-lactamase class C family)